jgi:hypothetical protein
MLHKLGGGNIIQGKKQEMRGKKKKILFWGIEKKNVGGTKEHKKVICSN